MGGGGSSGGSSGGNDTLWNAQANQVNQASAISGQLFDQYQQYAPTYLNNAANMVQEAHNGTLATRMRGQASADANASMSAGLSAATRDMSRYGAEFNPEKTAYSLRSAGTTGALARTDAMNKATSTADNLKWARNKDAFGMISGMSSDSVSALNSANSGMGNMASMQNSQNNLAASNAAGWGRTGASLAYGLTRKDGGKVSLRDCRRAGVRLATGGSPTPVAGWRQRMQSMPTVSSQNNSENPAGSFISGAVPIVAGEVAKSIAKPYIEEAKNSVAKFAGEAKATITPTSTQTAAPIVDKSINGGGKMLGDAPMMGGETGTPLGEAPMADGASNLATDAATQTALDTAATEGGATAATAAAEAATTAAAEAAAAETATAATTAALEGTAAANAWNPVGWGLGALGLIGALSKKDGGDVDRGLRRDMRPGGKVSGPGTETSDSIPAWLSDKEYVLNAEAVKMVGKKKLDEINEKGLRARYGDQARMVNGEAKPNGLAFGGMLGIAAGAGTDQVMAERQQDRLDNADKRAIRSEDRADKLAQLQVNADLRAKADADEKIRAREATRAAVSDYEAAEKALDPTSKTYDKDKLGLRAGFAARLASINPDTAFQNSATLEGLSLGNRTLDVTKQHGIDQISVAREGIKAHQATAAAQLKELAAARKFNQDLAMRPVNSQNDYLAAEQTFSVVSDNYKKALKDLSANPDDVTLRDAAEKYGQLFTNARQGGEAARRSWATYGGVGLPKSRTPEDDRASYKMLTDHLKTMAVDPKTQKYSEEIHRQLAEVQGVLAKDARYKDQHLEDPTIAGNRIAAVREFRNALNDKNSGLNLLGMNFFGKPQLGAADVKLALDPSGEVIYDASQPYDKAHKIKVSALRDAGISLGAIREVMASPDILIAANALAADKKDAGLRAAKVSEASKFNLPKFNTHVDSGAETSKTWGQISTPLVLPGTRVR